MDSEDNSEFDNGILKSGRKDTKFFADI